MFGKLLAAALCLLALTPQRFCTCAAASRVCVDSGCRPSPSPRQKSPPRAASCGHAHHSDKTLSLTGSVPVDSPASEHRPRGQHRPDCTAVSPAPAWGGVNPAPVADPSAQLATVTPAYDADYAPRPPRPERPAVLGPPHVPLFLSLLVLRN